MGFDERRIRGVGQVFKFGGECGDLGLCGFQFRLQQVSLARERLDLRDDFRGIVGFLGRGGKLTGEGLVFGLQKIHLGLKVGKLFRGIVEAGELLFAQLGDGCSRCGKISGQVVRLCVQGSDLVSELVPLLGQAGDLSGGFVTGLTLGIAQLGEVGP